VRVLVFHGYLLRGTGSNIYNAELAETLVRMGHDVHLLCQEHDPAGLGFVDSVGDWEKGKLVIRVVAKRAHEGSCTVYRPDIHSLLPVYVYDRYEKFEVKTFDQLSEEELDRYIESNVEAVRDVAEAFDPDIALANHLVMGPVILARALEDVPYAVKIHGSALEYTVKPHYQRFATYAREGLAKARAVFVGSQHTAESLWAAMASEDLPQRTRLGPPGVDTHTFAPLPRKQWRGAMDGLVRWLETATRTGFDARAAEALDILCSPTRETQPDGEALEAVRSEYDPRGIDLDAPMTLASIDPVTQPLICFVGKLIVSKGPDLLLAAWPLILMRNPQARLVMVGFGTYREGLELLIRALERADEQLLLRIIRYGRALEGGERHQLTYLKAFFDSLNNRSERYLAAARKMRESIVFTGRLEHGVLARLMPAAECVLMPSMFPEAFGMVAAEAAASGALPISAAHSGLAEVTAVLARGVSKQVAPLLSFERGMQSVQGIADSVNGWLDLDERTRDEARAKLAETAHARFSWERVADGVIAGARGRLDLLDAVPGSPRFA
jgi:glycosyltransferase involved in cell wall biosynthesis